MIFNIYYINVQKNQQLYLRYSERRSFVSDIILQNNRLKVEIMNPGEEYRGGRYDWTGMTRQITLDEKHTFLQAESPESMGGRGLSGVWEYKTNAFFDECELADRFSLMGIGLCAKYSETFNREEKFDIIPFRRDVRVCDDCVCFETYPTLCNGRAMHQIKEMWIEDNSLIIKQNLKNCGYKNLDLQEFNHNFMCFNGHPIDRSYKLSTAYKPLVDVRRGVFGVEYDGFRLIEMDTPTESAACKLMGFEGLIGHSMRISCDATNTAVDISEDFNISRSYNWFCKEAFCCESFCDILLEPGQSMEFTRRYTFEKL